jgi:competence protein ComEA
MIVVALFLALVALRLWRDRSYVPDPMPPQGPRAAELLDRIDPNTAEAAALAALPSIGPKLAQRIVEEREAFRNANPGVLPYRSLKDLARVRGIGEATMSNLEPYLKFPDGGP